jgi:multidrug resistance efflux pump
MSLVQTNRQLENQELLYEAGLVAGTYIDEQRTEAEGERLTTLEQDLDYQKSVETNETEQFNKQTDVRKQDRTGRAALKRVRDREKQVKEGIIKSPSDGIFIIAKKWSWEKGRRDPIQIGDSVYEGYELAEIPNLDSLQIQSQVSETEFSKIDIGTVVDVTIDALPGLSLKGKIVKIGNAAIERSRSPAGMSATDMEILREQKVFTITIAPEELDPRLRPGMTANCSIIIEKKKDVLSVPLKAVFNKRGKKTVYRATEEGYEPVSVVLGSSNRDRVIIEQGLEDNDRIFLKDLEKEEEESSSEALQTQADRGRGPRRR